MHHEKPPLNTTIMNDHGCRALTEAGRPVFLHVSAWPGTRLLGTSLNSGSGMWRVTRNFVFLIPVKSIPLGRSHGRFVGIVGWRKFPYGFSYFASYERDW